MRVDMAKKRMMDSSLVESVLGKNHSMIIDMKTGMSIRSLTSCGFNKGICSVRMFVVLLRIIKMFLFLMFSRKHCLMSIKVACEGN